MATTTTPIPGRKSASSTTERAGLAPRRLSRTEARRIAIRAQLLEARRPTDLLGLIQRLTFLQVDPTAVVAPSADLVAWSRLGGAYQPSQLQDGLERDRTLFEHRAQPTVVEPPLAMVRPMEDLGLFLAEMRAAFPAGSRRAEWLRANGAFRRRLLAQLRDSGPLASREIADTSVVPWQSSGWTQDRNVTQMLAFLSDLGEVAVAGRQGRQRLWDLAERVYSPDVRVMPLEEARLIRAERWLRALGVARPRVVGEAGVPVEIEGTRGAWRLDPEATAEGFEGRTALLSPFDRLSHDRARTMDLFGFDYLLEMYKPKAKRRWGYFALPILHHDALVGKLDATADRRAGELLVEAIHEDQPVDRRARAAIEAEVDALRSWLGVERVRYSQAGAR
jgi:uncharacterized protein YcaQ